MHVAPSAKPTHAITRSLSTHVLPPMHVMFDGHIRSPHFDEPLFKHAVLDASNATTNPM